MSWLSDIREALSGVAKTAGELVGGVKEAFVERAVKAPSAAEAAKNTFEQYFESAKQSVYRAFVTPYEAEPGEEERYVLSQNQYALGPEDMRSEYITSFEGAGWNPETEEWESFTFGIGHDELLSEEDVSEAADAFAADYGLENAEAWDVIGGIARAPEVAF